MSDSTEQSLKPVTEAERDHKMPPKAQEDINDAEKGERQADADQRGEDG